MTRESMDIEYIKQLQNEILLKMLEYQKQNRESYLDKLKNGIVTVCEELIKKQEFLIMPIKCIQISLMRYSILLGNPIIRIDAYGEGGVLHDALESKEVQITWPAVGLEEMREKLRLKYEDEEAQIDVLLNKMIDLIEYAFRETLRYEWKWIDEIEQVKELGKTTDFYISVGEYMDKQEYIYVQREQVDIFFRDKQETLVYRNYNDVIYQAKNFLKLDLEGSRFVHCTFEGVDFEESSLIDCTFENCIFKKCTFQGNDMRGCVFVECSLYKVEHQSNHCNACSQRKGIVCRPFSYETCQLNRVTYDSCDLSYALLTECECKNVRVDTVSEIVNSDFEEFVCEEEKEDASV